MKLENTVVFVTFIKFGALAVPVYFISVAYPGLLSGIIEYLLLWFAIEFLYYSFLYIKEKLFGAPQTDPPIPVYEEFSLDSVSAATAIFSGILLIIEIVLQQYWLVAATAGLALLALGWRKQKTNLLANALFAIGIFAFLFGLFPILVNL